MFDYLLIPAYAILDRIRGDNVGPGGVLEAFVMGMLVFVAITPTLSLWAFAFGALWALGSSPGWGAPIGVALNPGRNLKDHDPEWWQFGIFKKRTYAALILRGMMWGAPVLSLLPQVPNAAVAFFAITVAFSTAPWVARYTPESLFTKVPTRLRPYLYKKWQVMELIRGIICMTICVLLT